MATIFPIAVIVLGLVGGVVSMFFTDRELQARYGYGGQKALAQAEKDGVVPRTPRLITRLCGALIAVATFALVRSLF